MKRFSQLAASILLGVLLTACGSSDDNPSDSSSSSSSSSSESSSSEDSSSSSSASTEPVTIHMIGDSTMAPYSEDRRPQAGWGEMVDIFYNEHVTVNNWARGGRSSRSFYSETGRWPAIEPMLEEGDYVIIQFGHNDQKTGGDYEEFGTYAFCSDGTTDGENCADADHSYYQYLKTYVMETRESGAIPILMTPMIRKYFSGTTITEKGQHNLTEPNSGETYPRGDYPAAMLAVATEYDVPLIDLTEETKVIVESYGAEASTEHLYIAADSTHPTELFAMLIAKRAVDGLKTQDILSGYVVQASSLIASPSEIEWGDRYVDVPSTRKLSISAFDLDPASGMIDVTAPQGFQVSDSADSDVWHSTYAIDYENGAFTSNLYVRFTAESETAYSGDISFALDGTELGSVAVSGNGVAVGEGVDSHSSWFTEGSAVTPITDGPISAGEAMPNNLEAGNTKTLAVEGQDTSVARYRVEGPEMVARSDDRYLQLTVTTASQTFYVDTISGYLTSSGGSTVQADIEYSMSSDFSDPVKLNEEPLSFTKDTMTLEEFGVTIQVPADSTLYVRIFPWNSAGNTGKYLALYDFRVSGLAGE